MTTLVKKKAGVLMILALLAMGFILPSATMAHADQISTGKITGKTVGAGLLSFLIWPGIGQAVNSTPGKKVATHAIIGILPPYRFWSGYDALVDRKGGYWEGRI